ncbi:MAG: D-glycero-beta-D-manno-heptose 1-phosphate adenylyltransferase [Bacteroidia bacterium]|nr:D-glycero-beta-D-manno-heptose 1-phosphate adenylyltransferase [Bacteroidia bacterium]
MGNMHLLQPLIASWHNLQKKIVFTNGCFDLLHLGHVDYLSKAAALGDVLVIGLNADASVSRLKGPARPITDEKSRGLILCALAFVDAVVWFGADTPYELIKLVKPHVLVKGADYEPHKIVGYDIVTGNGGTVKTIDFLPGYSTSLIEKKIKSQI